MTKRVLFVPIGCLALLIILALSITSGTAQKGTGEREPNAPGEVDSKSSFIPVQGRLTDDSGNPLDGNFTISFRIYDVYSGGAALCADLDNNVTVEDGLFYTYMNMVGCDAFEGRQLYLGVQVESDAEMVPRQFIDNVPYAYGLRPGAVISDTLGSDAILHIENWATTGRGLRAYGMSQSGENYGVVGASRSPAGFGGYFYNNGGGVGLKAESMNGNAITANSENEVTVQATNVNDIAVWGSSTYASGVHGASGNAAGVEGFSLLGPGVYGESLNGVAIAANGVITSTEPTYLWVSGNDVRPFVHSDSTYIDFNSRGGARIFRGDTPGAKGVVLPITIPGTLYGQNVRLTEIELYWKGDTDLDSIMTIRLRRQTGVCNACYAEILVDPTDYICWEDTYPNGCTIQDDLTSNNVLTSNSGILYLTLEIGFGGTTWIDFDGVRLTLEYDN
ncbi:MAG: hypothetical protein A2W35_11360 [Chloroflexi bacterium RBG_16_57_11]|nr:MAG: hypothetical protein A2W35_11360 [Chloroflexi bacterium RBG_16_57_11]